MKCHITISAKVDRVVFCSWASRDFVVTALRNFRVKSSHGLRNLQTPWASYARLDTLYNVANGSKLFLYHRPRYRGLPALRIALNPDDFIGLTRPELHSILLACKPYRLLIAEIALDFPQTMDANFIRRHLLAGKSRLRRNTRFPEAAWYGAPDSAKFVRCYPKDPTNSFRVEFQANRPFLEKNKISGALDLAKLALLVAEEICFLRVLWSRLNRYVRKHLRHPDRLLLMAYRRRASLPEFLNFLQEITVSNPRRFLTPLKINDPMRRALGKLAAHWKACGRAQVSMSEISVKSKMEEHENGFKRLH
jgi:hypothetical protein